MRPSGLSRLAVTSVDLHISTDRTIHDRDRYLVDMHTAGAQSQGTPSGAARQALCARHRDWLRDGRVAARRLRRKLHGGGHTLRQTAPVPQRPDGAKFEISIVKDA